MKIKATQIVTALSVIAIFQLLFFWIIPVSVQNFAAVYPFYTVLTLAHTVIVTYICIKYTTRTCFMAILSGSIIMFAEVICGLLMGAYCDSLRTVLYSQSIITILYVLVMTFFISIATKESANSNVNPIPVVSYSSNKNSRDQTTVQNTSQHRKPSAVNAREH